MKIGYKEAKVLLGDVRRSRAGRWRKEVRELANWYWLRREMKRVILGLGGEANWRVARDDVLQGKLMELLRSWLEAQDLGEKDLCG